MLPYDRFGAALADALQLSRMMTFKNAAAGLPYGGAKCVIDCPPPERFPRALRRAVLLDVGDAVEQMGGHFVTGKDAGTTARDVAVLAERTRYVVGLSRARGGSGDPSGMTAFGVLTAIESTCEHVLGEPELSGRSLGILGMGKVGSIIAKRAAERGAQLMVADIDERKRTLANRLGAEWTTAEGLLERDVDVLVPCALSGVLTRPVVRALRCRMIVGAANNQLADDALAAELGRRGIVWAPDFIVNAGGLIQVASEVNGYGTSEARRRTRAIGESLRQVLATAEREGISTLAAGMRLVERTASANAAV